MDTLYLENELSFDSFTHLDGFKVANEILDRVKRENLRRIGVRVLINNEIIFQYLMDGKNDASWNDKKQNTVLATKHSSYYVFEYATNNGSYPGVENDENHVICGGGFPIIVNNEMIGVITVSGLVDHREDHQLIIDALYRLKRGEL